LIIGVALTDLVGVWCRIGRADWYTLSVKGEGHTDTLVLGIPIEVHITDTDVSSQDILGGI